MRRYSKRVCRKYQVAIEVFGKRWTGLILRLLIEGPMRFSELVERLEVCSDRMLCERLRELEAEGIVERRVLPEAPVRVEYRLTDKGRALGQVIAEIESWADRWVVVE
jgi:DNA-binding HxlR family transcriptional regulator